MHFKCDLCVVRFHLGKHLRTQSVYLNLQIYCHTYIFHIKETYCFARPRERQGVCSVQIFGCLMLSVSVQYV